MSAVQYIFIAWVVWTTVGFGIALSDFTEGYHKATHTAFDFALRVYAWPFIVVHYIWKRR